MLRVGSQFTGVESKSTLVSISSTKPIPLPQEERDICLHEGLEKENHERYAELLPG